MLISAIDIARSSTFFFFASRNDLSLEIRPLLKTWFKDPLFCNAVFYCISTVFEKNTVKIKS